MKALEKDRTRRYESANGLARTYKRYLNGDAVEACPPTLGYRLTKAYRRNKSAVVVASTFLGLLLGAVAMGAVLAMQAKTGGECCEDPTDESRKSATRADEARQQALERTIGSGQSAQRALHTAYTSGMNLAARAWEDNNVPRAHELLESVSKSVANRESVVSNGTICREFACQRCGH